MDSKKTMEPYKTTENLEFELHYADGNKAKVHKGILFEETDDGNMNVHIGTDNQLNMILAILEASAEMIERMTGGKIGIGFNVIEFEEKEEADVPETDSV